MGGYLLPCGNRSMRTDHSNARLSHHDDSTGRPCQRCIKRNIGHLCHNEPKPSQLAQSQGTGVNDGSDSVQIGYQ